VSFIAATKLGFVALLIVAFVSIAEPRRLHRCVAQVQTTYSQEQPNRTGFHHEKVAASDPEVGVETFRTRCKPNRARCRNISDSTADLTAFLDPSPDGGGQGMKVI
jgi:hypothetical protein